MIIAGSVAALLVAAVATWWFVLRSDAPPPVALDDAVAAATSTSTTAAPSDSGSDSEGSSTTPTTAPADSGVEGTWIVTAGGDSFAGYRVAEELAGIGFTEAAGRTSDVDATLVIEGESVTAVDVTVNMQTLESDDSRRDGRLRSQGIETSTFPTSTFSLTQPIALPAGAASGEPFAATAVGDLTLHGVTRSVEVALEAQLVDGTVVVVVGSTEIVFGDYAIQKPTAGIVLSIEDSGVMEFQLLFARQ
jgi:polyisoprenoid-binding protein YceI